MFSRSALIIGLLISIAAAASVSWAADVGVLSANVFTGVLDPLLKDFEQSSGHKVTIV